MPPLLQAGVPVGPELLIVLLFTAMMFLAAVVVSALIYRDAKRRDSDHALAWTVGAFLGGFLVWVLYVVVRDEVGDSAETGGL
ncbi:hypothetical protein GJ633_16685 [Halorubrum sp. CBA1125]|uniref:hypothetical protein n=1 Tax=Halorubrum sp. CBA1125 TaxID=2668072 RepID=UPI0012E7F560|nr:hypothetical protein [Halorubrum sp. CBA1125]MUW16038.1 hypothetical protein [Halorubrum sp. CBA1125]